MSILSEFLSSERRINSDFYRPILQQKLRDLERAFKDCFDKRQPNKRLPKFKKREMNDSFRFPAPQQIKLAYRHITLPKIGRMRFYRSCEIVGDIKNVTVSRQAGHWYIPIPPQDATLPSQFNGIFKRFFTHSP